MYQVQPQLKRREESYLKGRYETQAEMIDKWANLIKWVDLN